MARSGFNERPASLSKEIIRSRVIDKDSQHNYWPAHVYTQVHIPGHTGAHTRAPTHNLELYYGIFAPVPNIASSICDSITVKPCSKHLLLPSSLPLGSSGARTPTSGPVPWLESWLRYLPAGLFGSTSSTTCASASLLFDAGSAQEAEAGG